MKIYIIEYETLKTNFDINNNFICEDNIIYYLYYINNKGILNKLKLYVWLFINGIWPEKLIFVNNKKYKNFDKKQTKKELLKLDSENLYIYIDDNLFNKNFMKSLINLPVCDFNTFKKMVTKK